MIRGFPTDGMNVLEGVVFLRVKRVAVSPTSGISGLSSSTFSSKIGSDRALGEIGLLPGGMAGDVGLGYCS